jgi:acylglycerol lipase
MVVTAGSFRGARGLTLRYRSWPQEGELVAVVVIAHGFAEHSGRYAALAERLGAHGYAVEVLDHRGHGLSEGRRTRVERFADYVDDLRVFTDSVAQRLGASPMFLLGHSMGGLIALAYATASPRALAGLVLSAPAACPGDVSPWRIAAGRVLSRIAPDTPVLRPPLQRISRDTAVVDAYNADPLVSRGPIRARLGAEMLATMADVDARLPALHIPLLVMQGTSDHIVDPGCGPHVYDLAGSTDKSLKTYDGLWHEIFNEPERDQVVADLIAWLDLRARRGSSANARPASV